MADFPSRSKDGNGNFTGPLLQPSSRNFSFGEYPIKEYRALSGAVLKRVFGNRAFNYKLQLSFQNVDQRVVATIFDHYHGQGGTLEGFRIPSTLLSGYNETISSRIQAPSSVLWFYEASPEVESVSTSLSTVSISLVADLSYS